MIGKVNKHSIRKGFYLFLILSVSAGVLIVYLTVDEGTWTSLAQIRYTHILTILLLVLTGWCFDALRLQTLLASQGNKVSFFKSLEVILSGIFAAAVTPSHMGGAIVQIYMLSQEGVPIGRGWAIFFIKLILDLVFLVAAVSFGFLLIHDVAPVVPFKWTFILPGLMIFLLCYFLRNPEKLKGVAGIVIAALRRIGLIDQDRVDELMGMAFGEVDNFHETLVSQGKDRKASLFLALMCTVFLTAFRFMVAPVLLAGLGVHVSVILVFWLQTVLMLFLYVAPTPGGSGIAELGFASFFALAVPHNLLGAYTFLWRFFTNLLAVAVGGLVVIKFLGIQKLRTLEQDAHAEQTTSKEPSFW